MNKEVRVVQNSKITVADFIRRNHSQQIRMIKKIPDNALIRVLARGGNKTNNSEMEMDEWSKEFQLNKADIKNVELQASRLDEIFMERTLIAGRGHS